MRLAHDGHSALWKVGHKHLKRDFISYDQAATFTSIISLQGLDQHWENKNKHNWYENLPIWLGSPRSLPRHRPWTPLEDRSAAGISYLASRPCRTLGSDFATWLMIRQRRPRQIFFSSFWLTASREVVCGTLAWWTKILDVIEHRQQKFVYFMMLFVRSVINAALMT